MSRHFRLAIVAGMVGFPLVASTQASVLMLDFGSTTVVSPDETNSPYHAANPGFADTSWNHVELADVSASGLVYSDGSTATGVALDLGSVTSGGTTVALGTQPSSTSALGNYVDSGVYADTSVGTDGIFTGSADNVTRTGVQITGLAAGTYDIYVTSLNTNIPLATQPSTAYFYAGAGAAGSDFDSGSVADMSVISYDGSTDISTWADGVDYAKLTVTIADGEALNIAVAGDTTAKDGTSQFASRGFLNSIEIAPAAAVPEPASLALLGLGGLLCTARRRRGMA